MQHKNKRMVLAATSLLLLIFVLAGCGSQAKETKKASLPLKIYTTIAPITDFTKMIGGKDVEVESILPPSADAHTFEPTSKQVVSIAKADAFIYNGLGMESYAEKISASLKNEDVKIVKASKGIKVIKSEEHGNTADTHHHGDIDPHVWMDPIRAITMAENIRDTLIQIHPEGRKTYESNFQTLKTKLTKLNNDFQKLVAAKHQPEMVVSHAAYGYWQDRYGIKQIPISGLSPSEEPAQKDLKRIIKKAKKQHIQYVVFEQNVTPKVAEIVRKEIGAQPLHLHNLAVLTDKNISDGDDYFSLMHKNLKTLDKAL